MKTCDIIIPTYNGAAKLRQHVIPALHSQHIPPGWQVRIIVCDDGSEKPYRNNETWEYPWHDPLILQLPHGGRSKTRNAGIDASTADILVLLADDIILTENSLAEHLIFHHQHPNLHEGALGCIVWDPRIAPTPFMDWMMHGGQQNDYDAILGAHTCDPAHFFYGSFVSLKREFIANDRFSEMFTQYGWEDLELGARLAQKGFLLTPLHRSLALHRHVYSAHAIVRRQQVIGAGIKSMNTTNTRRFKHMVYRVSGARFLIQRFVRKYGNTLNSPRLFQYITAGEFWYGVDNRDNLLISEKNK